MQQKIEQALSTVLRQPVAITGAGRTDAGVNAHTMWAHFDLPQSLQPTGDALLFSLNSMLGPDIAFYEIRQVHPALHARFDATSRTYRYYATQFKSPFFYALSWRAPKQLDFEKMNQAAELLLANDDFASFAKSHTDAKTTICRLSKARWEQVEMMPGAYFFEITADRFLRNMVRAVVGTLVEVGRGKLTLEGFQNIINAHDRCAAGTSMPPQALYLWDVTYDWHCHDNTPSDFFNGNQ